MNSVRQLLGMLINFSFDFEAFDSDFDPSTSKFQLHNCRTLENAKVPV